MKMRMIAMSALLPSCAGGTSQVRQAEAFPPRSAGLAPPSPANAQLLLLQMPSCPARSASQRYALTVSSMSNMKGSLGRIT